MKVGTCGLTLFLRPTLKTTIKIIHILLGTHQFDLFCTSIIFISSTFYILRPTHFTSTCTSRPISSPDLTKCRSREVEVERLNYKKGRRYENGRSTENVELMRTPFYSMF